MNCTATTRLTAEECLARLDALRPLPRGVRMAAFASSHPGEVWTPGRHTLWQDVFDHCVPRSVLSDPDYDWPDAGRITAWAAPVRRLREERRALRAQLIQMCAALLWEKADGLASIKKLEQAWWSGRKCRLCGESMRCRNSCGLKCTGPEHHYMGGDSGSECRECGAPRGEP